MPSPADFLDGDIQAAAALMALLASEARLGILCRLLDGERSVGDLAAACGLSQSAMSQQLKRLKGAGLVQGRRDGQTIYCSVKGKEVAAVLDTLLDTLHALCFAQAKREADRLLISATQPSKSSAPGVGEAATRIRVVLVATPSEVA